MSEVGKQASSSVLRLFPYGPKENLRFSSAEPREQDQIPEILERDLSLSVEISRSLKGGATVSYVTVNRRIWCSP